VMAQRLVRRVCPQCRQAYTPDESKMGEIGLTPERVSGRPFYRAGVGCDACQHKGYHGRVGIHELLVISDFLRPLVMERADAATIRHAATTHDMATLRDDGAEKVLAGLTTVEEVVRVTQEEGL